MFDNIYFSKKHAFLDNDQFSKKWTALHFAIRTGKIEIVRALLDSGAFTSNEFGDAALDLSVASAKWEIAKLLVQRKCVYTKRTNINFSICRVPPSVIPHLLPACKKAAAINLSFLGLESLPVELIQLDQLKFLKTDGNPLTTMPQELRTATPDRIMAYLKGLQTQAATWKEVKLLFVGEEGVGKSSLLESFQNPKHKMKKEVGQNLATDGIAMSEWIPPEHAVKFNCWDFGGQQVYYPTHEVTKTKKLIHFFFLTHFF